MPSNNTTFDDDEILQILLKKSFQVPSTYEGTAWYDESVGKSQTILESTDINVEKIPTSPIWNTNALTSSELSSYGVELGIDDTAVSNNFSSTSTTIEAYDGTNYSTSFSFNPGAYIDSTGVVMLFIRLKLDVMVLSDASAIAYVKYPTDTSDNSILDNAFQFNFNLQSNVTSDIAEFKPFYYKLEYSSNGTSFTYLTQDVGNWSFDFKSGILVFSDEPTSINLDSGDLYFTFVKYVGPRGLDKLISVDGTFDSTNTTGYYENQIVVDSSNNEIYLLKDGSWNSIGGGGAFTIDGTNAYYNSGNVGIGTSSPSSILDVSGNANISSDLTVSGDLIIGSSSINVDTKLGELDTSVNLVQTSVSNLNISVNSLETITTNISYSSGTTTIDGNLIVSTDDFGNVNVGDELNNLETDVGTLLTRTTNISYNSGSTSITSGTGHNLTSSTEIDGFVKIPDVLHLGNLDENPTYADGGGDLNIVTSEIQTMTLLVGLVESYSSVDFRVRARVNQNTINRPNNGGGTEQTAKVTAFFEYNIVVDGGFYVFSDARIKKNVNPIQDDKALIDFRRLNPCYYEYVDNQNKGVGEVYGFIAQEVNEVLPNACYIKSGHVPNVFGYADISGNRLTLESGTFENLELDLKDSSGNVYESVVIGLETITGSIKNFTIKEIIDNSSIELSSNLLSLDISSELCVYNEDTGKHQVFVYGQLVNNFYKLDKNAIWTVAAAALQEVDRQQQSDKVRIAELETEVSTLKNQVSTFETQIADLLARVSSLENSGSTTTTDGS